MYQYTDTYLTLSEESGSAWHPVEEPDDTADLLPEDEDAAHLLAAILPRLLDDDPSVADAASDEIVDLVWGGLA
jgi:hypothetical protein